MIAPLDDSAGRRPRPSPGAGPGFDRDVTAPPPATSNEHPIVTVAKFGRLLSRSGWRIAKQIPGVAEVEQLFARRR